MARIGCRNPPNPRSPHQRRRQDAACRLTDSANAEEWFAILIALPEDGTTVLHGTICSEATIDLVLRSVLVRNASEIRMVGQSRSHSTLTSALALALACEHAATAAFGEPELPTPKDDGAVRVLVPIYATPPTKDSTAMLLSDGIPQAAKDIRELIERGATSVNIVARAKTLVDGFSAGIASFEAFLT